MNEADLPHDLDDPETAVREARQRYVAAFAGRCEAMLSLVGGAASGDAAGSTMGLRQIAHRLAGISGTVGFPATGAIASEIEALCDRTLAELSAGAAGPPGAAETGQQAAARRPRRRARPAGPDVKTVTARIAALRDAFARELAEMPEPAAASPLVHAERPLRVIVADDDEEQRAVVMAALRSAGHEPVGLPSGEFVVEAARLQRPDAVLLDVNMPGLDGYATCRALKASPDLVGIPVVFMTARGQLDERLAGLSLGADEYLVKPVDMRELLLRLRLLSSRARASAEGDGPAGVDELRYEELARVLQKAQSHGPVAVVLVRLPWGLADRAVSILRDNMRRRDAIGRFNAGLRVLIMPGLAASSVLPRVTELVSETAAAGIQGVHAGVAVSSGPDGRSLEALLAEADEALAEARYLGEPAAQKSGAPRAQAGPATPQSVLVADDDPDVVRIVDAQLRAAGYETRLAFDGDAALASLEENPPSALVLDLMMPRRTGFEVLAAMRSASGAARPRVVVLSARGREDDVTRAFELGADDYMTKPFSPQELMARISRLLR